MTEPTRRQRVTVYGPGPGDITLIPVDSLPDAHPDVTVTPWSPPGVDDWAARHIRFSLRWDEHTAGMSTGEVTAAACAIAARLLTEAGLIGAATLHPLPIVEFRYEYLVRPLKAAARPGPRSAQYPVGGLPHSPTPEQLERLAQRPTSLRGDQTGGVAPIE